MVQAGDHLNRFFKYFFNYLFLSSPSMLKAILVLSSEKKKNILCTYALFISDEVNNHAVPPAEIY